MSPQEPREPQIALSCRGLVKRYGDVTAVNGLDLEVRRGECLGLLGPNGAGKTTTVEILEGLTEASEGVVEVLGQPWGRDDAALRQRLGVQLQETLFPEKLTVEESLRLFRSFYDQGRTVEDVLAEVQLAEKRRARFEKLSGGQKQRLSIACALVGDPEVLFLDEPTTGLDPQARLKLWEIVEAFRASGGTVLLTTHYMEEAARLCDRVAVVDHGKLIALGSPAELIASLAADQIIDLKVDGVLDLGELQSLPGISDAYSAGGGYLLHAAEAGKALPALLALLDQQHAHLDGLTTHEATLEDVFVHLTGRGLRDG